MSYYCYYYLGYLSGVCPNGFVKKHVSLGYFVLLAATSQALSLFLDAGESFLGVSPWY